MSIVRPATLIVLLLALLAVEIPARVVQPEDEIINPTPVLRQARQQSTATLTILKTTTISSVLTTTIKTKKTCGILASVSDGTVNPGGITTFTAAPAASCSRRKRQFWDQPVFVALKNDDDYYNLQYYRLTPSQVLSFEPTALPQFRNANYKNPGNKKYLMKDLPEAIEPSFDRAMSDLRFGGKLFGGGINSLISSIVSNILVSTTTTTTFMTVYTSTSAITSYTDTVSFYVVGACYPAGLTTC